MNEAIVTDNSKVLIKIGSLAQLIRRSVPFIQTLHRKGILPEPLRFGGRRVYTQSQTDMLRKVFQKFSPRERNLGPQLEDVRKRWREDYKDYAELVRSQDKTGNSTRNQDHRESAKEKPTRRSRQKR